MIAGVWFPARCRADTKVAPEVSVYVTHSNILRSRLAAGLTWDKDQTDWASAAFEYDLDISLWSYFRRYVFKDPNAVKSKRVSFRIGYAKFPDLSTEDAAADEKRALAEVTFRFPLGNTWLLTDRNRGEYRMIGNSEFGRYRNRVRFERSFAIKKFRMTPYANAEVFYDGKQQEWNQLDGTIGSEFPWYYRTILEFSATWQAKKNSPDSQILGITLQKHL